MILQVHDELVFEVEKNTAEKLAGLIKPIMEKVVNLRVPIEVNIGIGKRWGETK